MIGQVGKVHLAPETFSGIKVFKNLPLESRQSLINSLHGRRYGPKQIIVSQNENTTDVYFIISGCVRSTIYSTTGKEVSFQDLRAGEMFGELAAIDGLSRTTHVITLSDSLIASMSAEMFWELLNYHPEVSAIVLKRLTSLIRLHCARIFEFSTLGVKNRIHAELLRLARDHKHNGNTVVFSEVPTHTEIANRVATHREAVTRELKRLETIGLIDWRPGRHVIKDVNNLERMVKDVRGE